MDDEDTIDVMIEQVLCFAPSEFTNALAGGWWGPFLAL